MSPRPPRRPASDPFPDSAYVKFPALVRVRAVRRKVSKKVRRFIHYLAESGFSDVEGAGLAAGLKTSTSAWAIYERFRDLIDQERLRRTLGRPMEFDEAMRELAWIARQRDDVKTKHAAIRTVLEVGGALGKDVDPRDRKALVRQAEELLAEFRRRMPKELAAATSPLDNLDPVRVDSGLPGQVIDIEAAPPPVVVSPSEPDSEPSQQAPEIA